MQHYMNPNDFLSEIAGMVAGEGQAVVVETFPEDRCSKAERTFEAYRGSWVDEGLDGRLVGPEESFASFSWARNDKSPLSFGVHGSRVRSKGLISKVYYFSL